MTTEDKKLIYIALCEYFPHGVKVSCGDDIAMTLRNIDENCFCNAWENEDVKVHSRWMLPYLRPMSSMTKEERIELSMLSNEKFKFYLYTNKPEIICFGKDYNYFDGLGVMDWLNAHHFDYRGLIDKGLALEAPEGMYND